MYYHPHDEEPPDKEDRDICPECYLKHIKHLFKNIRVSIDPREINDELPRIRNKFSPYRFGSCSTCGVRLLDGWVVSNGFYCQCRTIQGDPKNLELWEIFTPWCYRLEINAILKMKKWGTTYWGRMHGN